MKKFIASLLSVLLMIFTLCSCFDGINEDFDVVRVWSNDGGGKHIWMSLVDEFNRGIGKEKKIKIEWTTLGGDYASIISEAQKKGKLPEITALWGSVLPNYAEKGDILPLEDFEGGNELIESYMEISGNKSRTFNGKVYSFYSSSNTAGLIYNKDLFRKAGIVDESGEPTPPKTFRQMREYAKKITDEDKNVYGYSYPMEFSQEYLISYPVSASARMINDYENKKVDISEYRPIFETLLGMKEDGSIFPGEAYLDNDTSRLYFAEGKIGMMAGVSWDVGVLTSQFVANCDWGVAPFPTQYGVEKYPGWHDSSGTYYVTNNAKKLPDEKIMAVYNFIFSRETRVAMYENNVRIPCMPDVYEYADERKILPQFRQFVEIFDGEFFHDSQHTIMTHGFQKYWKEVWDGKMTLDDMIEIVNEEKSDELKV